MTHRTYTNKDTKPGNTEVSKAFLSTADPSEQESEGSSQQSQAARLILVLKQIHVKTENETWGLLICS